MQQRYSPFYKDSLFVEESKKIPVWLERYLFKQKVIFSTSMKCLRIRALLAEFLGAHES
jgi:hypothetical protein